MYDWICFPLYANWNRTSHQKKKKRNRTVSIHACPLSFPSRRITNRTERNTLHHRSGLGWLSTWNPSSRSEADGGERSEEMAAILRSAIWRTRRAVPEMLLTLLRGPRPFPAAAQPAQVTPLKPPSISSFVFCTIVPRNNVSRSWIRTALRLVLLFCPQIRGKGPVQKLEAKAMPFPL